MRRSIRIAPALLFVVAGLMVSCGGGGPSSSGTAVGGLSASLTAISESSSATPVLIGTAAMAVDAVSGGAVDATRLVAGTSPFDVDIVMLSVDPGYQGYQYKLEWDPSILAFDSQKHLMPAELSLCADAVVAASNVYTTCVRAGAATTFTGPLNTVTLHCIGEGTSPLHLKTTTEDRAFGTAAVGDTAYYMDTALTDASVTCQG